MIPKDLLNLRNVAYEFLFGKICPCNPAKMVSMQCSDLVDYKIMCFHGEPKVIFTCTERYESDGLKVTFFDTQWNRLPFEREYPASRVDIERPQRLPEMLEMAKKLANGIPFVRIDLYEIENRIYFGEQTFFPGSGFDVFRPDEWDYKLGEWINLSK